MNERKSGEYYGRQKKNWEFKGIIAVDAEYIYPRVDWHYHENPHFTYLIQGKLYEANKKQSYHLLPGTLLFHNWQDAHYNTKPSEFTRGFHIELNAQWFEKFDLSSLDLEGSLHLENPIIKAAMNKIFLETKLNDVHSAISVEMLVLDILQRLLPLPDKARLGIPKWVHTLREMIHEEPNRWTSLKELAQFLGIHPVHLSRDFPKYFQGTWGEYSRKLKLNRAALLMINTTFSLTEIAYTCGFYDQSHFIHQFRSIYGLNPHKFRKLISTR